MTLAESTLDTSALYSLGVIMVLAGIIVMVAAFALLFISSARSGKVKGGGALIIGPFPIAFGTDKESVKAVLWLSIALTVTAFVLFITLYLLGR